MHHIHAILLIIFYVLFPYHNLLFTAHVCRSSDYETSKERLKYDVKYNVSCDVYRMICVQCSASHNHKPSRISRGNTKK